MTDFDDNVIAISAELRDELARSDPRIKIVDPRTVPLRFHHMKAMGRSAAHCFESFQSGGEETLATRLGSGTHAMLLGKPWALFDMPAKKGKGRAPRSGEQWDNFKALHPGETILIKSEQVLSERMVAAIRRNPEARTWLEEDGAVYEQSIFWTQAGRSRQSTPDTRSRKRAVEVKTTKDASPGAFRWQVKRYCYHAQLVDQLNAIEAVTGDRPEEACIIAVEKKPPFVVQTYRLTRRDMELGAMVLGAWFNAFRVAEDSNAWDGYALGTLDLEVPEDDDDLGLTFGDEPEDEIPDEEIFK